ncbi:Uu.00g071140.m01.CDS01 [Anthostomella pinea]|uniref:Uu.00g071140.m01.CDS01 n=1 Tax=Anthostomella pinea TaxID=933095 RepID=A0AAI8VVL9_9PEZI|nr:Uu.00g071140.m01.CDS01 [Anthostomella pinea]
MQHLSSCFCLVAVLVQRVLADAALVFDADDYNSGYYGANPNQTYYSSDIVSPLLQVNEWDKGRTDSDTIRVYQLLIPTPFSNAPYIFLALASPLGTESGPVILRADDLSLVYAEPKWPNAHNAHVGTLHGTDYLVFFEGVQRNGQWAGQCLIYDSSYELVHNITAKGINASVDIHECQMTTSGSVLITVYQPIIYDLTPVGGPPNGELVDNIAQEIDVETGELLWTWRASDHYDLADSYVKYKASPGGWDFFHMNSIDRSAEGNFLINSRHTHTVTYVDGSTGDIIWTLGGKKNDFRDISDGNALSFGWQHHARFHDDDLTQVTFFDNHNVSTTPDCTVNCSRGLHLQLDFEDMTVQVVNEYFHPHSLVTGFMGSYQSTPNGNTLVGWGPNPTFTEYTPDGECVLDVQFDAWAPPSGGRGNYRAFKMDWKGFPSWEPSIASTAAGSALNGSTGSNVFVSWNGATEVKSWQLLRGGTPESVVSLSMLVSRAGFETKLAVKAGSRYVRALALDAEGQVLGVTSIVDLRTNKAVPDPESVV